MEPRPTFRYFRDPVGEGVVKLSDGMCSGCTRARGWAYNGPMYGPGNNDRVLCPWCIADGTAHSKFGCFFNDTGFLGEPVGTGRKLPADEAEEVEQRTPGFVTWQGNHWLECCAHACVYLGEASAADLAGRWAKAVPSIVACVPGWSEVEKSQLIRSIKKGAGPCAYVFECQVCGGLRGYWDIH